MKVPRRFANVHYLCMYTRNYKRIKTRIHITICLYDKGNEIIFQRLFYVGSCLVLNGNCHYMRSCWNTLNLMWVNRINMTMFANVWKLSPVMTISIHLHVWWQTKWKTSLCTWASFSNAIIATISWNVSWVIMRSLPHTQNVANGYQNHQWYDHTGIMKNAQL